MGSIYLLTVRQLLGTRRLVIMLVLASMPVAMAYFATGFDSAPSVGDFEMLVLSGMLAGAISPLVVLAAATSAFGSEVEDRTLANLTLAPIPRWQIAVPKLLASVSVAAPFIAVSAFVTAHIAFAADLRAVLAVTAAAVIGVLTYAAIFTWAGLVTSRAIAIGLVYIVLWEGYFAGFVSGVRGLSVRYHTIALMHGFDERRFAGVDTLDFGVAIGTAIVVVAGFMALTVRGLRRMDVP